MSKPVNFRFPEELIDRLRDAAKNEGVSVTDILIVAAEAYLGRQFTNKKLESEEKVLTNKDISTDIKPLLEKAIEKKVKTGIFFKPCPKEYQTRSAGKGK